MRERHATTATALVGGHSCAVVFVMQPAAGVSTQDRKLASSAIAGAYNA
jgi:hypothetical protein